MYTYILHIHTTIELSAVVEWTCDGHLTEPAAFTLVENLLAGVAGLDPRPLRQYDLQLRRHTACVHNYL